MLQENTALVLKYDSRFDIGCPKGIAENKRGKKINPFFLQLFLFQRSTGCLRFFCPYKATKKPLFILNSARSLEAL